MATAATAIAATNDVAARQVRARVFAAPTEFMVCRLLLLAELRSHGAKAGDAAATFNKALQRITGFEQDAAFHQNAAS